MTFEYRSSLPTSSVSEKPNDATSFLNLDGAEKRGISLDTRKDLSCLRESILQDSASKSHEDLIKETMAPTREKAEFLKQYEPVVRVLCDKYSLPKERFLALIERETNFMDDFQSKKRKRGSFGFCQLMKVVFDDMKVATPGTPKGRSDMYVPLLKKAFQDDALRETITSGSQGKEFQKVLDTLALVCPDGQITDKQGYNKAIESLYRLAKKDQHVNLFISVVLQGSHMKDISQMSKNKPHWYETVQKNISLLCSNTQDATLHRLVAHGDK